MSQGPTGQGRHYARGKAINIGLGSRKNRIKEIDLGITLLHRRCILGIPLTLDDIAVWAGCSHNTIHMTFKRAIKKVAKKYPMINLNLLLK